MMGMIFDSITIRIGLLAFQIFLFSVAVAGHESLKSSTCNWEARSNVYAIRAILENKMRANDTLLYELAGIFSNKHYPLNQVIVHYSIQIPLNEEDCDIDLHCELQYDDEAINHGENCPPGYRCLKADFVWGRYPILVRSFVFNDLDVCSLVIGLYEQREVTIHFTLKSPPSCNMSVVDNDTIEIEEFPCGWQCNLLRTIQPSSGYPYEVIGQAAKRESPLDTALRGITTKLLQYSIDKESLPSFSYDPADGKGYAGKLNEDTYLSTNPTTQYGIFLSSYILLQIFVLMIIFISKSVIYHSIFRFAAETNHVNFSLFWSLIVTFFVLCFNISFVFVVEGGICVTLLQLYLTAISLAPGLIYPVVAMCLINRKDGFFNKVNFEDAKENTGSRDKDSKGLHFIDHLVQILVMWFIYTVPHVLVLILFLISVSFFHSSNGIAFLGLYFAPSFVILWITNAIVIYLVSPYFCIFRSKYNTNSLKDAVQHIMFAVCLGLSLNLMNVSFMPFVGDLFYYERLDRTTIWAIFSFLISFMGVSNRNELVKFFGEMKFTTKDPKDPKDSEDPENPEESENPEDSKVLPAVRKFWEFLYMWQLISNLWQAMIKRMRES